MTTTKPRFHGRCRQAFPVPVQDLTDEQEKTRAATTVRHKGEWCAQVPCDFETEDPILFDAHMDTVHDRKLGTYQNPDHGRWTSRFRRDIFPVLRWKGPRLTDEGKPFEPKDLEPGTVLTWEQDGAERSGQVWSGAPYPKSVWVIPHEPREDERAVCLTAWTGELYVHETWTAKDGRRMAGAA